jgi:hypothetical protein
MNSVLINQTNAALQLSTIQLLMTSILNAFKKKIEEVENKNLLLIRFLLIP